MAEYQQAMLVLQLGIVSGVVIMACVVAGSVLLVKFLRKHREEAFLAKRIDHGRVQGPATSDGDVQ